MYLWKVICICKKQWMSEWKELAWVTCANTSENAIKQIADTQDLTGVEINKWKAEIVKENYVIYNVGF